MIRENEVGLEGLNWNVSRLFKLGNNIRAEDSPATDPEAQLGDP
jgi:hypothetical protein